MEKSRAQRHQNHFDPLNTKNELIAKAELGKGKPITMDLPCDKHSYGLIIPSDKYSAG